MGDQTVPKVRRSTNGNYSGYEFDLGQNVVDSGGVKHQVKGTIWIPAGGKMSADLKGKLDPSIWVVVKMAHPLTGELVEGVMPVAQQKVYNLYWAYQARMAKPEGHAGPSDDPLSPKQMVEEGLAVKEAKITVGDVTVQPYSIPTALSLQDQKEAVENFEAQGYIGIRVPGVDQVLYINASRVEALMNVGYQIDVISDER